MAVFNDLFICQEELCLVEFLCHYHDCGLNKNIQYGYETHYAQFGHEPRLHYSWSGNMMISTLKKISNKNYLVHMHLLSPCKYIVNAVFSEDGNRVPRYYLKLSLPGTSHFG